MLTPVFIRYDSELFFSFTLLSGSWKIVAILVFYIDGTQYVMNVNNINKHNSMYHLIINNGIKIWKADLESIKKSILTPSSFKYIE